MKKLLAMRKLLLALLIAAAFSAGGYGLYRLGLNHAAQAMLPNASADMAPASDLRDSANGKRVLYWHDPMVPATKFDKPGKSPFMDMELVPVYADAGQAAGVAIDPRIQQNLGIRTAKVKREVLIPPSESEVVFVQARVSGYLERLYVAQTPRDPVRKGQALAELFVPDWIAAQEDYLAIKRMGAAAPAGLEGGAQQRMRLAGMSEKQIRQVASSGRVHSRLTITAPVSGAISLEPSAREGTVLLPGTPLFRITHQVRPNVRKKVLLIPSEAVIQTGKRSVVVVLLDDGSFVPVAVEVGMEANGHTEIRKGLEAGQKIVVSGQFLIDSEASLKGVETRMQGATP